jgi:predicted Zn-dependent protease
LTLITGLGVGIVSMVGWVPSVKAALAPRKSIADKLSTVIKANGIDQATKVYRDLKTARPGAYDFGEKELSSLGNSLISTKNYKEAIVIFQLNAQAYPQSSGVYASLAEAFMYDGDNTEAMANCQRSLRLNPQNLRALRVLQKLTALGITIPDQDTKLAGS